MRTTIYIDGFNLYYRALQSSPYKWLDPMALCKAILAPHHNVSCIKYFTAYVSDRVVGDGSALRQKLYLRALKAFIPEIQIIAGHFSVHSKVAPLVTPGGKLDEREITGRGKKMCNWNTRIFDRVNQWHDDPGPCVQVINTEEKGSDVNLAVHVVNDAWKNEYDCCVIISNDSDLAESMRIVKGELGKTVGLFCAGAGRPVAKLKQHSSFVRTIRESTYSACQLPQTIPDTKLTKPSSW